MDRLQDSHKSPPLKCGVHGSHTFDLHREYSAACLHAVGLSAYVSRTLLLSLSTIADATISNPPWVNFQSARWVSFQSAPTVTLDSADRSPLGLKNEADRLDVHRVIDIAIRANESDRLLW